MADFHSHKCGECGTKWDHERLVNVSEKRYEEAHTCPTPGCGEVQYLKYFGPGSVQSREEAHAKAWTPFNQLMAFMAETSGDDSDGDEEDYA